MTPKCIFSAPKQTPKSYKTVFKTTPPGHRVGS